MIQLLTRLCRVLILVFMGKALILLGAIAGVLFAAAVAQAQTPQPRPPPPIIIIITPPTQPIVSY